VPKKLVVATPMCLEQRLKGLPVHQMLRQKVVINLLSGEVCQLGAVFISYTNGEQDLLLNVTDLCEIFCNWRGGNLSPLMSFKKTVYRRVRNAYKVSAGQLMQFVGNKYVPGMDPLNTIYFDEYGFFMLSMLSTRVDSDEVRSSIYAALMDAFGTPLGVQFMRTKRYADFGLLGRLISDQHELVCRLSRRCWLAEIKCRDYSTQKPSTSSLSAVQLPMHSKPHQHQAGSSQLLSLLTANPSSGLTSRGISGGGQSVRLSYPSGPYSPYPPCPPYSPYAVNPIYSSPSSRSSPTHGLQHS
jgi:hypothetical protein